MIAMVTKTTGGGGRIVPKRSTPPFPGLSCLLVASLLSFSTTASYAWHPMPSVLQRGFPLTEHQRTVRIRSSKTNKMHCYCLPPSSLSFLPGQKQTPLGRNREWIPNRCALSERPTSSESTEGRKGRPGTRAIGPARKALRSMLPLRALPLVLVAAAAIAFPARAGAADATAAVAAAATTSLVCPVSPEVEFRLMVRLVYAALVGAALGKERSFAKHSAGVRTMSLVSMGAAIFTVCSCYGFTNFPKVDASRMAANVASGVGFVGAGVITTSIHKPNKGDASGNLYQSNVVHGLTTAATIWLSAAVGVSCGVGLLRVATTAAAATIFILRMGRKRRPNYRPKKKDAQQQQTQQRLSSLLRDNVSEGKREADVTLHSIDDDHHENSAVDDRYDSAAEIHVTTHWDEHQVQTQPEERDDENLLRESQISMPSQQQQHEQEAGANKRTFDEESKPTNSNNLVGVPPETKNVDDIEIDDKILRDPSRLMEEIVRSACQSNNETATAFVDLLLDRYERRERVFARESRRFNGSEDSGYLP